MDIKNLIAVEHICSYYDLERQFISGLSHHGLIRVTTVNRRDFIHEEDLAVLEKSIRLYKDLNINVEGIYVIYDLLDKIKALEDEIRLLKMELI